MEIRPQSTNSPVGFSNAFNLERLTPGDVIQARILSFSSEGQTRLQIGPFKVTSDHFLGGKTGDLLFFEVLPHAPTGIHQGQKKSHLLIRLIEDKQMLSRLSGEGPSGQSGSIKFGTSGRTAVLTASPHMAGDPPRHAQNPVLLTLTSKRLLGSIAALGRKWRRQRRRQISSFGSRSRSAERISTQRTSCGNRAGVAPDTAGGPKAESRKVETPWSYAFGFLIESVGDEHRLVRIKLGTRRAKETMGTVGSILTASLMLRLEKIGDLEIDVQMVDDQIRVKFRVATDAVRGMVQSRLGEMHAALKALIPEVYCQVLVDRQRSAKDPYEITSGEEKKAIDCMI